MKWDDHDIPATMAKEGLPHRVRIPHHLIMAFSDWLNVLLPVHYPGIDVTGDKVTGDISHILQIESAMYKSMVFQDYWVVHLADADFAMIIKLQWGEST